MITIIAGSRVITNYSLVEQAVKESGFELTKIISGGANGVDKLGEQYANNNNIPIRVFFAEWDRYGRKAGILRNEEMAKQAQACIVIWDGFSKGSANLIKIARRRNLQLFVLNINLANRGSQD
jgi:hypothetical protein